MGNGTIAYKRANRVTHQDINNLFLCIHFSLWMDDKVNQHVAFDICGPYYLGYMVDSNE